MFYTKCVERECKAWLYPEVPHLFLYFPGMIVVRSDSNYYDFTEGGDSGALVTGVGDDHNAYAIHMSIHRDFSLDDGQGRFNASIMCRLDKSLAFLADRFNLNLDLMDQE